MILLVSADFVFIALHFLLVLTPILHDSLFSISKDLGYPEVYQYIKEFWIILLFLSIYLKTRQVGFVAWAMLFVYFLFDDAFQIHEQVGSIIVSNLNIAPMFGLRLKDYGEIAVSAIADASFLILIGFNYLLGSRTFKKATQDLLLIFLGLAFFGVFADRVHIAVDLGWKVNLLIGVIEDGGEMIMISLVAWYVFLIATRKGRLGPSLWNCAWAVLTRRFA